MNAEGICTFRTESGSEYIYDDSDGTVLPATYWQKKIEGRTRKRDTNKNDIAARLEQATYHRLLAEDGFHQLILTVTESCNLRCKYCSFSGNYSNQRTHQNNFMTLEIARKAIKNYFKEAEVVRKRNPRRKPRISFWGGEPLLAYDLLHEAILLGNEFSNKCVYNLTTNGTLLTEDRADFLIENDVNLALSLNGGEAEHNRLRVFADGRGSFEAVMGNVRMLQRKNPEYVHRKCGILVTYDTGTDFKGLREFFHSYCESFSNIKLSLINAGFTDWYSRYSREEHHAFQRTRNEMRQEYLEQLCKAEVPDPFYNALFGVPLRRALDRLQNVDANRPLVPFTAICVPGTKMAVDTAGNIHCCERIGGSLPIGHVDTGIEWPLVERMLEDYQSKICPLCRECSITRLCPCCFANFGSQGSFMRDPAGVCQQLKSEAMSIFGALWTLFEKGVSKAAILQNRDSSKDIDLC